MKDYCPNVCIWIVSHGFIVSWAQTHTAFRKMHFSALQIIDKKLCYYNYSLRAGFSSLLMSDLWKKTCAVSLSTRDPHLIVVSWFITSTVLWLWRESGEDMPSLIRDRSIGGRLLFHWGKPLGRKLGACCDYITCWRDSTGFVAPCVWAQGCWISLI